MPITAVQNTATFAAPCMPCTTPKYTTTKYKLWEELNPDPSCPYSGKIIPLSELFTYKFEIEHILPKSKTFNDRFSNKTIAYYRANRDKGERSPFEAFGTNPPGYNWNEILARAENLPANKRWKFYPNAMERFNNENEIISRLLTDTQYMSRVAKEYLSYVVGDNNVWVIPGQLTAMLRNKWGLNQLLSDDNKKSRDDHRHHAIDAFVIANTTRSILQKISRASEKTRGRFIENMPPPFDSFNFEEMKKMIQNTIVSFKPDHGFAQKAIRENKTVGQLNEETAYGLTGAIIKIINLLPKYSPYLEDKKLKAAVENKINNLDKNEIGKELRKIGKILNIKSAHLVLPPNFEIDKEMAKRIDKVLLKHRKPLVSFDKVKQIEEIIDPVIRNELLNRINGQKDKKQIQKILSDFSAEKNIRSVRCLKIADFKSLIPIRDKNGKIYKYYTSGSNYCADIYCPDKGENAGKWQVEIISMFSAHQKNFIPNF